ncbi:porin [Pontibacter ramchanderi]|uniref:Phosphate-selective porin O/P n=1 Tax=Pontibacter ramchanderi TaxID=1179743 RepID=A0A2N3V3U7_9BACT|nr:porin [Pontibacter ramchanderi]PKV76283.1 phosphate-selective porin O/P [Pontibacter ramchanderi]
MKIYTLLLAFLLAGSAAAVAQTPEGNPPLFNFKRGVGLVTPDSSFSINMRFRVQSRAIYNSTSKDDFGVSEYEMRVRRLRLRFEGFMYSPKLTYNIQLSFSRGDMDWSLRDDTYINISPNVVRDAVVYYKPNDQWQFAFGQTKLPGNRQRVISSGDQQFIDRSIVNIGFNIDRDFGFQAVYNNSIGTFHYLIKSALTAGEGRNVFSTDGGLAYTGRVELLPFGRFTNGGDYFEGDLEREPTPKLSLAGGMSHNEDARRIGGQIGRDLYEQTDIQTYIFDGLLKYKGMALYAEYMAREADNPVTQNAAGQQRNILTGRGQNYQLSYIFPSNVELAGRYSRVTPNQEVRAFENTEEAYLVGVTKYLRAHRLKLQGNVGYHSQNPFLPVNNDYHWSAGLQIELGI